MNYRKEMKKLKAHYCEKVRREKKQRLERVLHALGLLPGFRKLPRSLRHAVIKREPAWPEVCIDRNSQHDSEAQELQREIKKVLDERCVPALSGQFISLGEFHSTCFLLARRFSRSHVIGLRRKYKRFGELARATAVAFFHETFNMVALSLNTEISMNLMLRSYIDRRIYGVRLDTQITKVRRSVFRWTICRQAARQIRVSINGQARPAWQFGLGWCTQGIHWFDFNSQLVDLPAGKRYPVFFQSHALRRLRDRLPAIELMEAIMNLGLAESFFDPKVAKSWGNVFMLEYRMQGWRIGYLVCEIVEEKVVVKTFLFLTMAGTPESRLLKERLRLLRPDIEFTRLDRLDTFLSPELAKDPELIGLLREAGCGSLLDFAAIAAPLGTSIGDRIADLRAYLGLSPGPQLPKTAVSELRLAV